MTILDNPALLGLIIFAGLMGWAYFCYLGTLK